MSEYNMPVQQGWQCPICGRVLSPWAWECPCGGNGRQTITSDRTEAYIDWTHKDTVTAEKYEVIKGAGKLK